MKIAVLSDIHSNYHALKACVDHGLKMGAEQFLFLGDYVSDCAYPEKTMDLLFALKDSYPCRFIKGNREEYLLNHREGADDGWKTPSSASGSLLYTYEHTREKDFKFYETLNISGRMKVPGYPDLLYCHGSMEYTKGVMRLGSEAVTQTLKSMDAAMLLCGHTHIQGTQEDEGKKLVNVGSVGLPFFHGGDAQFGILHGENGVWREELVQLDYDRQAAVLGLHENRLDEIAPIWIRLVESNLLTGIDSSKECLQLALKKCQESEGTVSWSGLPERYWVEAARELGL